MDDKDEINYNSGASITPKTLNDNQSIPQTSKETLEDHKKYISGKPRRIVIRAKITND